MKSINWLSPYMVMAIVLVMYLFKVVAKLTIGHTINSPMIIGDGYHNVADIFEAVVVIATIWFSRRPQSAEYPFGRKNIESLFSVAVGLGLCVMALRIAGESLWVLGQAVFTDVGNPFTLKMSAANGSWAAGLTLASAGLSMMVSRYQIRVGRKSGHEALVADGQETRSDGMIELTVFAGVCGEYLFGAPWIEYLFAIAVAWLMTRTGYEILGRGLASLLQRSIGKENDEHMRAIAMLVPGVRDVVQLKSFRVGQKVVLVLKLESMASTAATRLIKHAVVARIVGYLREQGFEDGEFFVRFDKPDPRRHRIAVLLRRDDEQGLLVANNQYDATHVAVCDMEHGEIVRATLHSKSECQDLVPFLQEKRVTQVVVFDAENRRSTAFRGIATKVAISSNPRLLGLKV